MKQIFKPLVYLKFDELISESVGQTKTGCDLINKYKTHLLNNHVTCTLVNNFVKEARKINYDREIMNLLSTITEHINANLISWRLFSVCEQINNNNSAFNYLNRNATKQVYDLLENNSEQTVIKYIKAGVLKGAMFCEGIRSVVRDVFKQNTDTSFNTDYSITHPISVVEESNNKVYFTVNGVLYALNESTVATADWNEVSEDFKVITNLFETKQAYFDGDTLKIDTPSAIYEIYEECDSECGHKCTKCKRKSKVKQLEEHVFENSTEMREFNKLVIASTNPRFINQHSQILESVVRCFENYNNFALLDNVSIVSSRDDVFMLIESEQNIYARSIQSNHDSSWSINDGVVESLDFVKEKTGIDLFNMYSESIQQQFEAREEEEKIQIEQELQNSKVSVLQNKIEQLTERYKDDPVKIAVLSKMATELMKI